jgi:hypothetical protein
MKPFFRVAPGVVRIIVWLTEHPTTTRVALFALPTLATLVLGLVLHTAVYASPIGGGGT